MGTTMRQVGNMQLIITAPDKFESRRQSAERYANSTRKVVVNGDDYTAHDPSARLNPNPRVDQSPMKFQKIAHKKTQSVKRLMNCKSIDKFDRGTHPEYPKAKPDALRRMKLAEVRSYCLAGAVIQYDQWTFQRKVVFENSILGSCTKGDIDALIREGIVKPEPIENGHIQYRK